MIRLAWHASGNFSLVEVSIGAHGPYHTNQNLCSAQRRVERVSFRLGDGDVVDASQSWNAIST